MAESNDIPVIGAAPSMRVPGGAHSAPASVGVSQAIEDHTRTVAQQIIGATTVLLSEIISGIANEDREVADGVVRHLRKVRETALSGPEIPRETQFVFDALLEMLPARDGRFRPPQQ